jgi:hypothetical protein
MGVILGIIGIAVALVLLFKLAIFAVPFFVGMQAFLWGMDTGAGPIGAALVGLVAAGVTLIDAAEMYPIPPRRETQGRTEEIIGTWLRARPGMRERVVIATKVFNAMSDKPNDRGLSRKHIMESIDGSLKRLGTDYVDLYQIHRFDPATPLEETQSFADSIYTNLTITLHDFPALATRLGCDPLAVLAEREAENLMAKLTPLQRQRLARRLLGGDAESEGQGVA